MVLKKCPGSFGVRRSNIKVKFQTTSNGETNGTNMYALGQYAKASTVTSSPDLRVRGQRSKRSNVKQRQTAKLTMPTRRPWASMQKCPRWPRRQTYGSGVKGQKRSNIKLCQMAKLTVSTSLPLTNTQKCPRWSLHTTYGWGGQRSKRVKYQSTSKHSCTCIS